MLRSLWILCGFFVICLGVYAFDAIQPLEPTIAFEPCNLPLMSGVQLRISEVGFDGTDERIEITNIGDAFSQEVLYLSGAKTKIIALTGLSLDTGESIILGDAMNAFSGELTIVASGQGLSLPDTTGFSLTLFSNTTIYDSLTFSHDDIAQIPNTITLEAVFSGIDRQRLRAGQERTTLSGAFANPGIVYCSASPENGDIFTGEDYMGTGDDSNNYGSGGYQTGDYFTGQDGFGSGGYESTGDLSDGDNLLDTGHTNSPTFSCFISEIHSIASFLPEYIEIYCPTAFSGTLAFSGLGAGITSKTLSLYIDTGSYVLLASSFTGFYDTGHVYTIAGISLLDAGETISMTSLGYTQTYTYPSIDKDMSYYPSCNIGIECTHIGIASPGFSYLYIAPYIPTTQPATPTALSTPTTNTYYQNLYETRKAKATQYQKDISSLKKDIASLEKVTKSSLKTSKATTSTKSINKPKVLLGKIYETNDSFTLQEENTPILKKTSSKVGSPKATKQSPSKKIPKTQSKSFTTIASRSTTKATSSSNKTKSTTKAVSIKSKAYILLVNEHRVYKSYIAFLHQYLEKHLFTQYKTLKIAGIESLLKKSLQSVKQQHYTYAITTGKTVSSFDFPAQRRVFTKQKSLYIALQPFHSIAISLMQRMPLSFLEKLYTKYRLALGKNLSKNDI